jgi:IG-like fold at C-terminal of FixG, putative oxidoreductase
VLTRTTIAGIRYGIGLEPAVGTRSGAPGTPVSYTLTLRNTGNIGDTFMVQLIGAQWPTQATPLNVQLAPGQTATIVVTVRIPATAAQQAEDNALVQVISQGNSGVSAQVALRTIAGWRKLYLPVIRR